MVMQDSGSMDELIYNQLSPELIENIYSQQPPVLNLYSSITVEGNHFILQAGNSIYNMT